MIKLNLGSNNKLAGNDFINVDILELPNVDLLCDLNITPFQFKVRHRKKLEGCDFLFEDYLNGSKEFKLPINSVDEIVMDEVLEHISFRIVGAVLREIYRILKVGGKLRLQVPDCGKAMEAYCKKEICDCVPHKLPDGGEYKANPNCTKCHGKATMNPDRWLFSFTGAQKHPYDIHRSIFTKEILDFEIRSAGFGEYHFKPHQIKLKLEAIK